MAGRSVNKVTLIGNLGGDPEIRYTNNNTAVCNISLATSWSYRNRDSGEDVERTEWHRLVFFSRLAEIASEYLGKGSKIYIEGRLQTREWDDQKTGQKRYMTEIVVSEMVMLDRRGDRRGEGRGEGRGDPSSRKGERRGSDADTNYGDNPDDGQDFDDNIPF